MFSSQSLSHGKFICFFFLVSLLQQFDIDRFQFIASTSDDNSLLSNQDTNQFLVRTGTLSSSH